MPLTHGPSSSPLAPALQYVIKEQVADHVPPSFHQAPTAAGLTYAEVAARPGLQTYGPLRPPLRPPVSPPARPVVQRAQPQDHWRMDDNRPISFFLWPCWTRGMSLLPTCTECLQQCASICATFPTTAQLFGQL